jgi:hypothetical protein
MEKKTMKLQKNKQNNMIAGIVAVCVLFIAVMVIVNITGGQDELPIDGDSQTTATGTAESGTIENTDSAKTEGVTTQPPVTQSQSAQTRQAGNTDTEPPVIEVTLAPVEIPNERVREIIEQNDVQVAPPAVRVQTTPAPSEQRRPNSVTVMDGQKYVWHPDFGWVPDYGEGTVIIMDVEDDGRRYEGGW